MRTPQLLRRDAEMELARIRDLQMVIVHGDFHSATGHGVVTVTECIRQRLPRCPRRIVWKILPLHLAGNHPPGNVYMVSQKLFGVPEQAEYTAPVFPIVRELRQPVDAPEPSQTHAELRKLCKQRTVRMRIQRDRGVHQPAVIRHEIQPNQRGRRIRGGNGPEPPKLLGRNDSLPNLIGIQVGKRHPRRAWLILPTHGAMQFLGQPEFVKRLRHLRRRWPQS